MNNTYITAILRDQINLLLRFGYIDIPVVLSFCSGNEVEKSIFSLFSKITPYYDESHYILLEFEINKDVSKEEILRIEIQDIIKIYPLSRLAAATIKQSRLDGRIKIEEPIFEHLLYDIELLFRKNNLLSSIKALWKICEIDNTPDKILSIIGTDNIINGIALRKKGIKANMIKDQNYWSYLIAYDSYNLNFPSSILGYFYDAGEVFAFSNNQETFVGSKYFSFLEKIKSSNPNCTLKEIVNIIESSNEIGAYKAKTTYQSLKAYLAAPIFLMLKEDLRKELEFSKTKLAEKNYLLKVGGEDFKAALILLASFFGFDKFYDLYYDTLNLRIFKNFKEQQKESTIELPKYEVKVDLKNEIIESLSTDEKNDIIDISGKSEEAETKKEVQKSKIKETVATEEISTASTVQEDKKENKFTVVKTKQNIIQDTIQESLTKQTEIKLTDIAIIIKEQTGQSAQVGIIENAAKQMNDIEIIKIGKAKGVRKKVTMGKLFNQ